MKLDKNLIKQITEDINSEEKRRCREEDYTRFLLFNGKTKGVIKEYLIKEFANNKTVEELLGRLVPLNVLQKIIIKLAGVYTESPARDVSDGSQSDQELLDLYVSGMSLNNKMKEANRYFKLFKRNLQEYYVNKKGVPSVRNLPRHCYEVYRFDEMEPETPNVIVKIQKDDMLPEKQILSIWSDESFIIANGRGEILTDKMAQLENPEGVNPYGVLPFVYINEATYSVDPLSDDDLISVSIAIPVVLTDLLYACKYQCWSIIYTIGATGDIPANPSSVLAMEYGPNGEKPEVGVLKAQVDIKGIIELCTNILSTLLTTKNLSAGTIKTTQSVGEAVSGISKMLDQSESVEDKKDQQGLFTKAEKETWILLSENLIPVWRKKNLLAQEFNKEFSQSLDLFITFPEPKAFISEKERLENAAFRLEKGFSTYGRELAVIYPNMREDQIEELKIEIFKEKLAMAKLEAQLTQEENGGLDVQSNVPIGFDKSDE